MLEAEVTLLDQRTVSKRTFNLEEHQLTVREVHRNLPPSALYEHAIRYEKDASIAENGALVAYSGVKTGRSPKDKRVVKHPDSETDVWWGPVNIPLDAQTFAINRERALDYLNTRERLYCFDGFAGWDPKYRIKVRVICSRPYHALFMHTMLIRPTPEELASFGKPDFVIYNAGAFPANRLTAGMASKTSVDLSLEDRELVILGTEYAGEMKKGVFTVVNYLAPEAGRALDALLGDRRPADRPVVAALRPVAAPARRRSRPTPSASSSATTSTAGATTASSTSKGGCYAKAINLSPENEPDIFQALRFGAVLENVVLEDDRTVDFADTSITENTRGAYPIEFIRNAKIPCVAGHPTRRHLPHLRCVRRAAAGQLAVARAGDVSLHQRLHGEGRRHRGGRERAAGHVLAVLRRPVPGVASEQVRRAARREDEAAQRARLAGQHRLERRRVRRRASASSSRTRAPSSTRSTAARSRRRNDQRDPVFGFDVVTECPGVPAEILWPRNTWADKAAYDDDGQEARRAVPRELQEVRGRRQCGNPGRRSGMTIGEEQHNMKGTCHG